MMQLSETPVEYKYDSNSLTEKLRDMTDKYIDPNEKPLVKDFEMEPSILSKFVWPDQTLSKIFFGILAQHGGTYVKNTLVPGNIDVEMTIPIGEISLLEFLDKIFQGRIPADCSLFLQILLQKDFKNRNVTLALGLSADAGIDVHVHTAELEIGRYTVKDVTLHSLLRNSSCTAKSQWVIKTGLDQYLGMTRNGPKIYSDLEWRTHMANGINSWLRDDELLCFNGTLLQQAMYGLNVANVQIHCQDNVITIDVDQIRFNGNQLTSILSSPYFFDKIIVEPSTNNITLASLPNIVMVTRTLKIEEVD